MYAIVEIAGHQYKVRKDQRLYVNRLEGKEGAKVSFDKVLLTDNDGKVEVGAPVISGLKVDAKIIEHLKADKVLIFKKKRRKGYQKLNGHRQMISLIEVTGLGKGGTKKASAAKAKTESEPQKDTAAAKPKAGAKKAAPKAKEESKAKADNTKKTSSANAKTAASPKTEEAKPKAEAKKTSGSKAKKEDKS